MRKPQDIKKTGEQIGRRLHRYRGGRSWQGRKNIRKRIRKIP